MTPNAMDKARAIVAGETPKGIEFHFRCDIDLATLATWPPETVRALMEGIAQITSAKALYARNHSRRP